MKTAFSKDYHKEVEELTKKFISFNTINPPGNEEEMALFVGTLLKELDFEVEYIPYQQGRLHIVAERKGSQELDPIVFTGHFDTVPLGAEPWDSDPLIPHIQDGKLYGRGSTDMKGGVAAMIIAARWAFRETTPKRGIKFILTADEELGCGGAKSLVQLLPKTESIYAIIVGEPTSNIPAIGHKGGIYLQLSAKGKTAHSSMPHLGDNAIYKIAKAITTVEDYKVDEEEDPLLGRTTLNVGQCSGGLNLNSVPDKASFTIDARTTSKTDHPKFLQKLKETLGPEIDTEVLADLNAVSSDQTHPFVKMVYRICDYSKEVEGFPKAMPYLTDGSVLQKFYGGIPTIILGPGEAHMAHKINEYCFVDKLHEAVNIYKDIMIGEDS